MLSVIARIRPVMEHVMRIHCWIEADEEREGRSHCSIGGVRQTTFGLPRTRFQVELLQKRDV